MTGVPLDWEDWGTLATAVREYRGDLPDEVEAQS